MGDETETHLSQLAALENFANHREFFCFFFLLRLARGAAPRG